MSTELPLLLSSSDLSLILVSLLASLLLLALMFHFERVSKTLALFVIDLRYYPLVRPSRPKREGQFVLGLIWLVLGPVE